MSLELKVGQVWRAKRPAAAGSFLCPMINDRQIIWIDSFGSEIQYDSPSVAPGRKYPKVTREAFEKWAGREVKSELPPGGEWARWNDQDRSQNK
ncbi:hypothetical protein BcepF1.020 [Burkholderia phage BcepF1]|uniref:Uncharacterized protein n=1 Tax=Burkholderia phage BcepF1 TaxID=2886897 RepID=A1YZS4_9CAUD|nr:hypothetical protein BcepF1.020 [Burkholderia phage BcepF1]ABL96751.1 hypothetical protein BcepF1.020 [Burkholderia phage BcepF1]